MLVFRLVKLLLKFTKKHVLSSICLFAVDSDKFPLVFLGPVMTKFTIALREIGTYKEVLRSQVVTLGLVITVVSMLLLHF